MTDQDRTIQAAVQRFVDIVNDDDAASAKMRSMSAVIEFAIGRARFYLAIGDGALRYREGVHAKPDLRVRTTAETLRRILSGTRSVTHFIADGDLDIESGRENYLRLLDLDRIIGSCRADLAVLRGGEA